MKRLSFPILSFRGELLFTHTHTHTHACFTFLEDTLYTNLFSCNINPKELSVQRKHKRLEEKGRPTEKKLKTQKKKGIFKIQL
jgi:hypothetical protein